MTISPARALIELEFRDTNERVALEREPMMISDFSSRSQEVTQSDTSGLKNSITSENMTKLAMGMSPNLPYQV